MPSDDVRSDGGPHLVLRRRSWEEMDTLRAQMLLQGYPLAELRPAENERVWSSLVQRRRVPQLLALLGWGEDKLQLATERVRAQRGQHRAFQRARARRHLEKAEEP